MISVWQIRNKARPRKDWEGEQEQEQIRRAQYQCAVIWFKMCDKPKRLGQSGGGESSSPSWGLGSKGAWRQVKVWAMISIIIPGKLTNCLSFRGTINLGTKQWGFGHQKQTA